MRHLAPLALVMLGSCAPYGTTHEAAEIAKRDRVIAAQAEHIKALENALAAAQVAEQVDGPAVQKIEVGSANPRWRADETQADADELRTELYAQRSEDSARDIAHAARGEPPDL